MAIPTDIFTGSAGASAHNGAIVTGEFIQPVTAEDPLWIHLGFVPKLFFLCDPHSEHLFVWATHFEDRTCKLLDTSVMQAAGIGVTPIDGNGAASIVTAGDVYIKEWSAHDSTARDPQDRIIGVKLEGICGCEDNVVNYYAAVG